MAGTQAALPPRGFSAKPGREHGQWWEGGGRKVLSGGGSSMALEQDGGGAAEVPGDVWVDGQLGPRGPTLTSLGLQHTRLGPVRVLGCQMRKRGWAGSACPSAEPGMGSGRSAMEGWARGQVVRGLPAARPRAFSCAPWLVTFLSLHVDPLAGCPSPRSCGRCLSRPWLLGTQQ